MSMKKRPKQARACETVEIILQATTHILKREGRQGLTTNRVAEVAGVSIGSLYQYFPNKASLVAALRERYDAWFLERLVGAVEKFNSEISSESLREALRFGIEIHREDIQLHNELAAEIPEEERRVALEMVRAALEANRDRIRRSDLEMVTYIVVQVCESLVHNTALYDPKRLDDPRFLDEVCDLMERYLLK